MNIQEGIGLPTFCNLTMTLDNLILGTAEGMHVGRLVLLGVICTSTDNKTVKQ